MATPRKPTRPTTAAIDQFCAQFDDLFCRRAERQALRAYLMGLLLPRDHNKTLTVLASLVPNTDRQRLHHFLHDAPWDANALNQRRLTLWCAHPSLGPHAQGVLIIDETGDRKRGHGIPFAAQQYIGKLGHTANGVVAVTSHWTDGTHHVPLGVLPYRPASRLPRGKTDPAFHTKPELAWTLIEDARATKIPFRLVVADCIYGENARLEGRLFAAKIPYILAVRPHTGTWQIVEDKENPPPFTPAEAASRVPPESWQKTVRPDSHGQELVRYVAELDLGLAYGPTKAVRLIAATDDPTTLRADATWYMITSVPLSEASPAEVYTLYSLRDWIEHYYKPVKHELGWADFQMRQAEAIIRHWQLVMLAFTFSLLVGSAPQALSPDRGSCPAGKKIRASPADRLERDPAPGPTLAVPVGAAHDLLAEVVI